MAKNIVVHATWDDEAGVWFANSDDVPGLATEADTVEALLVKLRVLVPELLELNGVTPETENRSLPIELMAHRLENLSIDA